MNGLTDEGLTPLQDLVMETLAARYRLGERTWTFTDHPAVKRAMRALEGMGLIGWKSGITENTTRAWLSAQGRELFVTAGYVPPIFGRLADVVEKTLAEDDRVPALPYPRSVALTVATAILSEQP